MMSIKAVLYFVLCILASFIPYYEFMIKEIASALFRIVPSVSTHEVNDNKVNRKEFASLQSTAGFHQAPMLKEKSSRR